MDMQSVSVRAPEFVRKTWAEFIPVSCAVTKPEYIKSRKEIISQMDSEIKALRQTIKTITDKASSEYQKAEKRLKKCIEIKQNCESSIDLAKKQMHKGSYIR